MPVSEKNGAHSVLDKNAVDLLWSCRRCWKLVVNSILLFHCVNARCFIDKSVIPLAPSTFAIDIVYTEFIKPGASIDSRHFRTGQKKYFKYSFVLC